MKIIETTSSRRLPVKFDERTETNTLNLTLFLNYFLVGGWGGGVTFRNLKVKKLVKLKLFFKTPNFELKGGASVIYMIDYVL